jgi:hypothetical protein
VTPFTRALAPPFIGRQRDFYIPKTPSSSKNIPNVNTYKNVFSISYIYKPAKGPIRRTIEGGSEWELIKILLEGDGNSYKMSVASNTLLQLTTQVGQAHVATGVPLDLGTNTQPSDPRTQRNTKPRVYRPTPVRLVSTTSQIGP